MWRRRAVVRREIHRPGRHLHAHVMTCSSAADGIEVAEQPSGQSYKISGRATDVFNTADGDGDGTLSKEEFRNIHKQYARQKAAARNTEVLLKQERTHMLDRWRRSVRGLVTLAIILTLLILGNAAIIFVIISQQVATGVNGAGVLTEKSSGATSLLTNS